MHTPAFLAAVSIAASVVTGLNLNVTALGTANGVSTIECWQMETPFAISTQAGTVGSASLSLGSVANITYTVIPANFDAGLHNAPYNQWVVFTSGLAHLTLPTNDTSEAYVVGGELGVIFASDIAGLSAQGHRTQYPGVTETTALQIPTEGNVVPAYELLHSGPCTADEVAGLRGLATAGS